MRLFRFPTAVLAASLAAGTLAFAATSDGSSDVLRVSAPEDAVAYHPQRFADAAARPEVVPDNVAVALPAGVEALQVQYGGVAGRSALEPTLGVQRDGTVFYASSPMAVDTAFTWAGGKTEVMRSDDGGATWDSVQLNVGGEPVPPINVDPMVYVDEATDRVFNLDLYGGCSNVNFSDDDGESWLTNPAACGSFVNDHQTIIAGPRPADASPLVLPTGDVVEYADEDGRARWLYYCFNRVIDADCGRSVDGGLTWTPTASSAFLGYDTAAGGLCGGLHGHIDTDPDGYLLLPKGHCGRPFLGWSADGGDTWSRGEVSDINSAGTHLSVAADEAGNWYFVWWDQRDRLPWLSVSRDKGATWETPMMIAPPGVKEVNFPVIDAGSEGRLAITFPGTTDPDEQNANRAWNHYMVVTTDALADTPTFQAARANALSDPAHRGAICSGRCGGLWDFQDTIVAPDGYAWGAVADDCAGNCDIGLTSQSLHAGQARVLRQVGGPLLRVTDGG